MCTVGESPLLGLLWPCEFIKRMNIPATAGRSSSM